MNKRRRFKAKHRRRLLRRAAEYAWWPAWKRSGRAISLRYRPRPLFFHPAAFTMVWPPSPDVQVLADYARRKSIALHPCGCPPTAIDGSRCGTCGAEIMGVVRTWTEPRQDQQL